MTVESAIQKARRLSAQFGIPYTVWLVDNRTLYVRALESGNPVPGDVLPQELIYSTDLD